MKMKIQAGLVSALVVFVLTPIAAFGASYFFVDDQGNVGIGNSDPQAKLDVSGALYSRMATDTDASSVTVNWSNGNVHSLTLNTSNTTFSFSNGQAGGEYDLILNQDGTGGRTVTWPASVVWEEGISPALTASAGGIDLAHFVYNGTSYLGSFASDYSNLPPIAFDTSSHTYTSSGSSSTVNTAASNSNELAILCLEWGNSGSHAPTGVTVNGSSGGVTQIGSDVVIGGRTIRGYYFVNPSTSAVNYVASFNNTADDQDLYVALYSGAAQSGQPDSHSSGSNGGAGTLSLSTTVVHSNSWLFSCVTDPSNVTTAGTGTTLRASGGGGGEAKIGDSNGIVGSGNQSMGWSNATAGIGGLIISIAH